MTTSKEAQPPWADGPCELLRHGLELLRNDTDSGRRLAMISIDNAVELMIRTYLGLPNRITGLGITRKQLAEIGESFPALLDALETHAVAKITGIDLGSIEWHHRLRNQLYHQGNGLTIERNKVELYAEIANQLFKNLFGFELIVHPIAGDALLGEFIRLWSQLEQGIWSSASDNSLTGRPRVGVMDNVRFLAGAGFFSSAQVAEIHALRRLRNEVLHGQADFRNSITPAVVARVRELASLFPDE